jgi:TATA-box binding protein (TBP) (component of TFIID and TFIIIB)
VKDFRVCLINTDFAMPFEVNNRRLQQLIVKRYKNMCIYEPCIYPGVKILFQWNRSNEISGVCGCAQRCDGKGLAGACKKVTIAVFQTGSVIITGATSMKQIDDAYNFTVDLLTSNRANIERATQK